jgi:hypothetical protein
MQISYKNPIWVLKSLISSLFKVEFEAFDFSKYHQDLPQALKELYEIEAFMAKHNCAFETIRFFCNQDRLLPYQSLKLSDKTFAFLCENQNNWVCKTSLKSDKVFFEDTVEPQNSRFLNTEIDTFLTNFALYEMMFSMQYYFGLESENINEIKENFKKTIPIWEEKAFIYGDTCSFYLIEDDCLVGFAGMNIFATNNEKKYIYYKNILKHYTF